LFNAFASSAQKLSISFYPVFNNKTLIVSEDTTGTGIQINSFRFFITDLHLIKNNKRVWTSPAQAFLIDLSEKSSSCRTFNDLPEFDEIGFSLGIDSITNVSGAFGGDLDPSNGMYWTWQSGYINMKLEGFYNKQKFTFHLGGYAAEENALQHVVLKTKDFSNISIALDLSSFFTQVDLKKNNHIMSPSAEAVKISAAVAAAFKIIP
jgi:hypothetical protein